MVSFDPYKNRTKIVEMPQGEIQGIERWSAFVVVRYKNYVEFIQFDKREIIDSVSKIMLNEQIKNIEYDL